MSKKFMTFSVSLFLLVSVLTSCAKDIAPPLKPLEVVQKASETMDKFSSYSMKMQMVVEISVLVGDNRQNSTMTSTTDSKTLVDGTNELTYSKETTDGMGQKSTVERYSDKKNGTTKKYMNDGSGWKIDSSKTSDSLNNLIDKDCTATKIGQDTIGGVSVSKYEILLSKAKTNEFISSMDLDKSFDTTKLSDSVANLKMNMYIDETNYKCLKLSVDIKDLMNTLMTKMFESTASGTAIDVDIENADVVATFADFNSVPAFTIPSNVLAAK